LVDDIKAKLIDTLIAGFNGLLHSISRDFNDSNISNFTESKTLIEMFCFSLHWALEIAESTWKTQKSESESILVKVLFLNHVHHDFRSQRQRVRKLLMNGTGLCSSLKS
jgi:hypothetical protein